MISTPTEDQESIALVKWLKVNFGEFGFIHVANERKTSPRQGALLKAKGVAKGFPDYLIFTLPNSNVKGIVIELKRRDGKNKPTKEQEKWLDELTQKGYICNVCFGAKNAMEWLLSPGISFCLPLTTPTLPKREKTGIMEV